MLLSSVYSRLLCNINLCVTAIAGAYYEKHLNNHLERRFIYEIKIVPIYIYEIAWYLCFVCFVFHSGFQFVKFRIIYQFTLVKGCGSPPNQAVYKCISKYCVFESRCSLENSVYSAATFSAYRKSPVQRICNRSPGIKNVGSTGSPWELLSDGLGFEYRPGHRLSWLRL
jgi:hypothetical protein